MLQTTDPKLVLLNISKGVSEVKDIFKVDKTKIPSALQ